MLKLNNILNQKLLHLKQEAFTEGWHLHVYDLWHVIMTIMSKTRTIRTSNLIYMIEIRRSVCLFVRLLVCLFVCLYPSSLLVHDFVEVKWITYFTEYTSLKKRWSVVGVLEEKSKICTWISKLVSVNSMCLFHTNASSTAERVICKMLACYFFKISTVFEWHFNGAQCLLTYQRRKRLSSSISSFDYRSFTLVCFSAYVFIGSWDFKKLEDFCT